jgi:hypothetical protein
MAAGGSGLGTIEHDAPGATIEHGPDRVDLTRSRRPGPARRSRALVVLAALMETILILPVVDRLADANPTIHFTQHGLIFLGGVLMGVALRDAFRLSQSP